MGEATLETSVESKHRVISVINIRRVCRTKPSLFYICSDCYYLVKNHTVSS